MDSRTGDLYSTRLAALQAGVPEAALIEMTGPEEAVRRVSIAVQADAGRDRKAKRKAARASRKRNR